MQKLDYKDAAIHNYLLSLYAQLQPDKLMVYLECQGNVSSVCSCSPFFANIILFAAIKYRMSGSVAIFIGHSIQKWLRSTKIMRPAYMFVGPKTVISKQQMYYIIRILCWSSNFQTHSTRVIGRSSIQSIFLTVLSQGLCDPVHLGICLFACFVAHSHLCVQFIFVFWHREMKHIRK